MNKVVLVIVVAIVVIGGAILFLLGGNKKITNVVPSQPTTEPEEQLQQAPTFSKHSNTIVLTQSGFDPQTLTVGVGTKVSWVNKSGGVAAVNSDPHPIHSNFPPLNLNSFEDGEFLELIFEKMGTYKYHDHLNPSRIGTIIVEQ